MAHKRVAVAEMRTTPEALQCTTAFWEHRAEVCIENNGENFQKLM
jgi:hypothetical protein